MPQNTPGFGYYQTGLPQLGNFIQQGVSDFFGSTPMRVASGAVAGAADWALPITTSRYAVENLSSGVQNASPMDILKGLGWTAASVAQAVPYAKFAKSGFKAAQQLRGITPWAGIGGILGAREAVVNPSQTTAPSQPMAAGTYAPVPLGAPERSWAQTQLAGLTMKTNVPTGGLLSPSEIEYFAQQQRDLRRQAAQASARDALEIKQAKEKSARETLNINQYLQGALQDYAVPAAGLGPAAELGVARTLQGAVDTQSQAIQQNLKDYLARQNLSSAQRGSNISAGLSDIEKARIAQGQSNIDTYLKILGGM